MKKSELNQLIHEILKEELSRVNLKEGAEQAPELEATLSKAFNHGENVFVATPPGMATIARICKWCDANGIPYVLMNARDTELMANLGSQAETLSDADGGLLIVDEYGRANPRTRAMLLTIINEHTYGQVASVVVTPGMGFPINDAELNKFVYSVNLCNSSVAESVEDVELEEGAFSGGMAGDNSINGGKVGGMGASTQPDHKTYLNRIKAKNPDLVDIITIKAKDLKPNMMTQAGQIKTAEVKYSGYHSKDMVYVMHTNGWDYFKELDADMEVMADPDDKSKPFTGAWKEILSRGLKESLRREPLTVDNIFENLYY